MSRRKGYESVMVPCFAGPLSRYGLMLGMLCGSALPAWSGTDGAGSSPAVDGQRISPLSVARSDLLDFDIPAQPLAAALYRFGDISHQPALFPSDMIAGLTSSAVHGRYSAETALRLLLAGTGLVAEEAMSAHGDIFLLKKTGSDMAGRSAADNTLDGFPALIQARVMRALCANARTVPGSYRSILRVQVDAAGRIGNTHLIDSTGDSRRDAALLATLQQVWVGVPPSAAMRQPFTLMLSPTDPDIGSPCGAQAGGRQP